METSSHYTPEEKETLRSIQQTLIDAGITDRMVKGLVPQGVEEEPLSPDAQLKVTFYIEEKGPNHDHIDPRERHILASYSWINPNTVEKPRTYSTRFGVSTKHGFAGTNEPLTQEQIDTIYSLPLFPAPMTR